MNQQLQTLKGFRDFLPAQKRARDFVVGKVKEVFETFGFEPLETPTLEYASLLLGKYGEEADRLVYQFEDRGERKIALRYDQTVPSARVLAQYQNQLPKYFRRYQIQNNFRAEKPQKGRFREFTQCDIDIFGTTSPVADAEIVACTYFAYKNVGFPEIVLKLNDRQVLLQTLEKYASEKTSVFSIIQSVDKLDKIGDEGVIAELVSKGLEQEKATAALLAISQALASENLQTIIDAAVSLGVPLASLQFAPTLARGLDYYTGMIIEVTSPSYGAGSLGGGGRYDRLIANLSGVNVPAVGIAFGLDRMVEAAGELGLLPGSQATSKVLVALFTEDLRWQALQTAGKLRQAGISTQVYPEFDKLGKQMKYASDNQIPFAAIIGDEEAAEGSLMLKNLLTGEQKRVGIEEAAETIKAL